VSSSPVPVILAVTAALLFAPAAGGQEVLNPAALPSSQPSEAIGPSGTEPTRAPVPAEVTVRGSSVVQRQRSSPLAVEVVDLAKNKKSSDDLGEVLARTTSLRVQREGGLGSAGRYSLNGLSGDRVRFFIDGVPLEYSSYQMGVGNVPVNLIDRVEVYQGVVPVRFGADALGGAVNLVTDENVTASKVGASYQLGSFGTHRAAVSGRKFFENSRTFARIAAFFDTARNDYPIDVEVFDERGKLTPATVRRFHDGYRGTGLTLGAGLIERPWADRLVLQAYAADYQRDVQHNVSMTVPYGEVEYGRGTLGASANYAKSFLDVGRVDTVVGYSFRRTTFLDVSHCRYDWNGNCFIMRPLAGELDSIPVDRVLNDHSLFGRAQFVLRPTQGHTVRFALAPTYATRSGYDREIAADVYDPLRAERRLLSGVLGGEYEVDAGFLGSIVFAKLYQQSASSEEKAPNGLPVRQSKNSLLFGAGDNLRVTLAKRVYLKGSFEYAARLPSLDERFGDGGLVLANPTLEPERSQNYNLGAYVDDAATSLGKIRARLSGAFRRVTDLVVLLNTGTFYKYDNVLTARVLGVDTALGWSTLADSFGVDLNFSYQDMRNTSTTGPAALFEGDRVPNVPSLQAGAAAYVRVRTLFTAADSLELDWTLRHVGKYLLGWESAANRAERLEVPSQTTQSLLLAYTLPRDRSTFGGSFEIQNLTDAKVFDFYGVQRPGRSFYGKLTFDYQ
jgi:vitamin B12 transporter